VRIAICGRNLDDLRRHLAAFPVEVDPANPELVISYGGDGSLLGAEREFPGVPKCPLRDSRSTPQCPQHREASVLGQLFEGRLARSVMGKLQAIRDGRRLVALNDISINRFSVASAVRYRLWLDDELYATQVVGDGLVVATPFGSTGYYRSITHSLFRIGIGLAFNNSTEPINHLVIGDRSRIRVQIVRGPALLAADNDPAHLRLEKGDTVEIARDESNAVLVGLDVFRCRACFALRQGRENPE